MLLHRSCSAVIVSCAWHVPRALQSFRTAGLEVAAWSRRDAAGVYDRWAETLRAAYDDLAIRPYGHRLSDSIAVRDSRPHTTSRSETGVNGTNAVKPGHRDRIAH